MLHGGSKCSLMRAINGRIRVMRSGVISSCQSADTFDFRDVSLERFWS